MMEVGVYGLGRFGSFWSGILSQRFTVKAFSRNPSRQAPTGVLRVDEDEVLAAPVLFFCVSISSFQSGTGAPFCSSFFILLCIRSLIVELNWALGFKAPFLWFFIATFIKSSTTAPYLAM